MSRFFAPAALIARVEPQEPEQQRREHRCARNRNRLQTLGAGFLDGPRLFDDLPGERRSPAGQDGPSLEPGETEGNAAGSLIHPPRGLFLVEGQRRLDQPLEKRAGGAAVPLREPLDGGPHLLGPLPRRVDVHDLREVRQQGLSSFSCGADRNRPGHGQHVHAGDDQPGQQSPSRCLQVVFEGRGEAGAPAGVHEVRRGPGRKRRHDGRPARLRRSAG